ncbi:arginine--tRNA ligase, partial [Candidatus Bathyarchaeota archaeon]|nr:arginine--tRNA ligase [Candidatus Bathyarchaeota archaeon]
MKTAPIAENPFQVFRQEAEKSLADAFKKLFPEIQLENLAIEKPANPEFGQLASSLCFELAKKIGEKPFQLAQRLAKAIDSSGFYLVEKVAPAGGGYINFHVNLPKFSALTLESAKKFDANYGFVKTDKPLRVIVEHTSANPLHPINVATARNPVLGDTLARILKARGHTVYRHFYIDDVGRQSSVVAYGYEKLGKPKPEGKPDQFIGKIYTTTSCIVEINRLKKELERAKAVSAEEETTKTTRELDDWVSVAAELKEKYPDLFDQLLDKIGKDQNSETAIKILNQAYEAEDKKAKQLVRTVTELCIEGFKQTLKRIDVTLDAWDWESEFVWSGHVEQILKRLKKSPYTFTEAGVTEFDAEKVIRELDLRKRLNLREGQEVPPLTLMRADGTTLYTTRDVAYTLIKFEKADKVINVIGMDQSLAQLQLKIALHALGYGKYADNLVHFAYNLVTLPGFKMSSRRGRYIPFDEVMDEAVKRAYEEVSKHSPQLSEEDKNRIADFVGLGAVRYALVEVDTSKPVVFTWDRVLNFEKNSAPYIQYTHARACSIIRKAARPPTEPLYELLREKLEQEIILTIASFPDTFIEAAEYLKPNTIADYANSLADKFNTFYNAYPVIKAEPEGLSEARLTLTDTVRIVLRNAL